MLRVFGLLMLAILASAVPARGDSFLDRPFGTPLPGPSDRTRAMGGAGCALADGAYSLVDNPAALILSPGSRLQLNASLARVSENRFAPLFDTFGSFVAEEAVAVNDNVYSSLNGGIVVDRRAKEGLTVAIGIFDRYDPRYDYFDERRNTALTDDILAERYIRTRGMVRTASFGAAFPLWRAASVGGALNWYFGRVSDRDALVPRSPTVAAGDTTLERQLSGASGTLGATVSVGERLALGLAFETAPTLHDDYVRTENGVIVSAPGAQNDLKLPWRLQGGATYRPRNSFRTTFALDVIYMPWSNTDDPLQAALDLRDTWDVRFGLEQIYYNVLPARVGFRYAQSYALQDANRATFTFGAGSKVEHFRIDLAGEIGKRTSRQAPLMPRASQGTYYGAGQDRVDDTLVRMTLGAQIEF